MSEEKEWIIAGEKIPPGTSADLKIHFSESYIGAEVFIPLRVIRAEQEGPRLFLTGGIHGDELNGAGIIRELLFDSLPELQKGALICVPVVNIYGLENRSRYLPDRRDLNRCFPGSKAGSLTSRLAHKIFTEVIQICDFGIDLHSASRWRTNYPNVRADMNRPEVRKLARDFGLELIINRVGPEKCLRRCAVEKGVPVINLEAGETWKIEPGAVRAGVRGCLNTLKSLEMIEGKPEKPLFQITVKKTHWSRARRGGFLFFHIKPGDLVEPGQELATVSNIFGRERDVLTAEKHAFVMGVTTMPAVKPGEPVCHLAHMPEEIFAKIRRKIKMSTSMSDFRRTRRELSTSIQVQQSGSGQNNKTGENEK